MSDVNTIIARFHKFEESRLAKVKELININEACQALLKAECDEHQRHDHWEKIYKFVFSTEVSLKAKKLLEELGILFEYYNPDRTYEDDAIAFIDAFNKVVAPMAAGLEE